MPIAKNREYRAVSHLLMPTAAETQKRIDSNFYVEGYATTFERYLWWESDGVRFYEEIAPDALSGADTSDVIMQYDHTGKVLARLSNATLGIEVDEKGLFMFADLSKSTAAKELYEEISAELITRMSWAFTVEQESYERIDANTRLRRIERIKKVYDVSAVSIPANDGTEISARSFAERSFQAERQELLGRQARLLNLRIKMMEV